MNFFTFHTSFFLTSFAFLSAQCFVPERDVYFLLRVRNRSFDDDEVFNFESRENIKSSVFDTTKLTSFQIHGYMGNRNMKIQLMLSK